MIYVVVESYEQKLKIKELPIDNLYPLFTQAIRYNNNNYKKKIEVLLYKQYIN